MTRIVPSTLTANYTFSFDVAISAPALLAANSYTIALRGPATVDIAGVVRNNRVTFASTITTPGNYAYTIFATDSDSAKTLIDSGKVLVNPDPALISTDQDLRTHAERVLASIEAVLEKRATKDQENYTIAGRSLARTPIADLLKLRDKYRLEVANQGRKLPRAVLYRFGSH